MLSKFLKQSLRHWKSQSMVTGNGYCKEAGVETNILDKWPRAVMSTNWAKLYSSHTHSCMLMYSHTHTHTHLYM